ncbi:uncharacterized protein RJT20DRAFT_129211 [Scheffersomyces xylosifermentans]|uniref:uncharacterized protein n=1 Tax=Scheffersomyces xylosifermentans TaxID=1304137 RepID=UPI00315D2598
MSSVSQLHRAAGLFVFPTAKAQFAKEVKQSQVLGSLWRKDQKDEAAHAINAESTLPLDLKPKIEIYEEIRQENADSSTVALKLKQSYGYGKALMHFYKTGVSNVWRNRKEVKELRKYQFKLSDNVNSKGKDVDIRIPGFSKLTSDMAQALYISQIETKTEKDKNSGHIIKKSGSVSKKLIDTGLFNMSRSQFQLIRRTNSDLSKIPWFLVVLLIFMESTPLVCYAFPQLTPSTCVLPSILPRLWSPGSVDKLHKLTSKALESKDIADLALRNAYNLPIEEVRLLSTSLRLTSKFIPAYLYGESLLRRRLQEYYNYLKVDNYYLSGLNGENSGNVWNLSKQELLLACLERNLIRDLKKDVQSYQEIKDEAERSSKEAEFYTKLRLRLFQFIVDFEKYNIGYLGLGHLLKDAEAPDTILEWRSKN